MTRFWLFFGALALANLLLAVGLVTWTPDTPLSPPLGLRLESFRPVLVVPQNPERLENRVRETVRRELEALTAGTGAPAFVTPVEATPVRERAQTPRAGRQGPPGDGRRLREPARPETPTFLTPFGVYRPGPAGLGLLIASLSGLMAAGVLLAYLLPYRLSRVRATLASPWRARLRLSAIGVLGYVVALLLVLTLAITLVGIPLALLAALLIAGATVMAIAAVALTLGQWLRARLALPTTSPVAELSLGLLLIYPLGLAPFLGWLFFLGIVSAGFGALLVTKFGSPSGWSLDALMEAHDARSG